MANIISSKNKLFKDTSINNFLKKSIVSARDIDIGNYDKLVLNKDVFSIPQNTILIDSIDCIYESHKKYIDIHILIEGEEAVELINLKNLDIEPYETNYENDYFLYTSDTVEKNIILDKTKIAIFGFNDIHKVCIKSANGCISVRKVVLKVTQSLFEKEFIYE